jgi:predicted enzyme related to lactoylglutathione lyase
MHPPLGRLIIYTRRIPEMIAFYGRWFGYSANQSPDDRIVELQPDGSGPTILLHQAGKAQKEGQALVKFVFDVEDVEGFRKRAVQAGIEFGPIHQAEGYVFANAKDPSGNSISISSRAFATRKR